MATRKRLPRSAPAIAWVEGTLVVSHGKLQSVEVGTVVHDLDNFAGVEVVRLDSASLVQVQDAIRARALLRVPVTTCLSGDNTNN